MKHYFFSLSCILCILSWGCIQKELPSSEADIKDFSIPGIELLAMDIKANSVYIMVNDRDWHILQNTAPDITVSDKATIAPPLGQPVNLNTVKYVVTAENGRSTKTYTFNIAKEYNSDTVRFAFDDWSITGSGYYSLNDESWSNGNSGIVLALGYLGRDKVPENYPSQMTTDGKSGSAVKLVTTMGGEIALMNMNIAVWAGSFFLGNFNTGKIMTPLAATEFGRIYRRKPLKMRGFYKYMQGGGQYRYSYSDDMTNYDDPDYADSCAIYAVFYQSDNGTPPLTAYDIDNSPYIIARADLPKNMRSGGTAMDGNFREFEIDFEYRIPVGEVDLESHSYKLAIVFSSSAAGGKPKLDADNRPTSVVKYAGKVGSTLIVDEVEIINE